MPGSSDAVVSCFNLAPLRIGGTEVYARELSEQLANHGWQSVLCFNDDPPQSIVDFLQPTGAVLEVLPHMHQSFTSTCRILWNLVRKYRPRIIHMHYTDLLSPAPWLGRCGGVDRVFYTDHTSRPENFIPTSAPSWKRFLGKHLSPWDGVFSGSKYGTTCVRNRGYQPAEKIHTVYNAINVDIPASLSDAGRMFRQNHQIPENSFLIAQVGQVAEYKGIIDLVNAMPIVLKSVPSAHLVIVGEGPLLNELPDQIAISGIEKHVTLTGLLENPITEGAYLAADVCCQVSRWEELFGFTIAEEMACQRPVIGTRVGGIPELIDDGMTGYLVEKRDVATLAARIISLAENSDLRKSMGIAGRLKAVEHFNVSKNVAQLIDLYEIV